MGSVRPRLPDFTTIVAVLILLLAGAVIGVGEPAKPTTAEIQRRINDLFTTAQYDSILHLIPAFIQRAEADHDSILLGRMYTQRGRVLFMIGRGAEAEHDLELGIQMAEAARDTVGWMPAVHFKGFFYTSEGRYDDAMRCFEKRLLLAEKVRSPVDEAWAHSGIGYVFTLRGDNARAKEHYARAIMLFRQSESPERETTALIGLGRIETADGNEAEARRCFQRAWVVAREAGDRENEMWAANNLGALEADGGDPGRAAAYSQRAFDIAKEIDYPSGMVIPAINLALRAEELGEFSRAESILSDARDVCVTRGAGEFLNMVDFTLADLRINEGRYEAAGATYRRLLSERGQLEPQHRDFAVIGLARVLAHDDSVSQAIDLLTDRFEAKGADVYALAEPQANMLLSRLSERAGNLEAALRYAQRAFERARHLGWSRTAVSARLRESVCYRALARESEAYAALLAGLDSLDATRGAIATPDWREVYGQETSRGVLDAGHVLLEYPVDLPTSAREKAFFDSMQRFKTRSLLDRISEPRTGGATERAVTIDDLQRRVLRPGELLLEYFVGSAQSYLVAVTLDSVRLVKLPGPDSPLAESIELYHHALASADPGLQADFPPERLAPVQQSIGTAIMGEVIDLVEGAQCVLVAPDGFFASIPFGTLILTDPPRLLMETKDVVQIPSASVLALQRSRPAELHAGAARVVALEAAEGSNLPGAHDEVRDLSRRYAGVRRVRGLLGGADGLASVAAQCDVLHVAVHALIVDQSPWQSGLLLSGDLEAVVDTALTTRRLDANVTMILSTADSTLVAQTFQDPFVRAWQIAKLSLPSRLTVLAGCETAGGRLTTGEGVLGLTAAFMSAGVPVVVSSLWPIDDRATVRVMQRFYEYLSKGESVATSLRLAQLDARRARGQSHPFYWAGFTVVGDGSMVVAVERASHLRPALLVLALAFAGATMAFVRRRRFQPRLG
jgi:CHAT domain-containing protein/tetratricopeptide (TPR) repeat protein